LLTDEQASAVNLVTYGPGQPEPLGPAVECVWQSSAPKASVTVQVAVLSNVAEAQAAYAEALASQDFAVKDVPNFGDKAAIARASAAGVLTGGIYVREGSIVFDVVYLNGTPPSDGLLTMTAYLVLGRLPTS
jgi:hypothetical protein